MFGSKCVWKSGSWLAILLLASAAQAIMVVDRGLPVANLNNAAGVNRSNVAWAAGDYTDVTGTYSYITGDDFTLPGSGPGWQVDTIRTWVIGGSANNDFDLTNDQYLGLFLSNVSLYVGSASATTIPRVALENFAGGSSDATVGPNVVATRVQYAAASERDYQDPSGGHFTIVQLDFNNLNLTFAPGAAVQFAVQVNPTYGVGAFNHASNAALSGNLQQGSDDLFREFLITGGGATADLNAVVSSGPVPPNFYNWDKASDINVQVFAIAVPEPGAWLFGGLATLLGGAIGFRRNR